MILKYTWWPVQSVMLIMKYSDHVCLKMHNPCTVLCHVHFWTYWGHVWAQWTSIFFSLRSWNFVIMCISSAQIYFVMISDTLWSCVYPVLWRGPETWSSYVYPEDSKILLYNGHHEGVIMCVQCTIIIYQGHPDTWL